MELATPQTWFVATLVSEIHVSREAKHCGHPSAQVAVEVEVEARDITGMADAVEGAQNRSIVEVSMVLTNRVTTSSGFVLVHRRDTDGTALGDKGQLFQVGRCCQCI